MRTRSSLMVLLPRARVMARVEPLDCREVAERQVVAACHFERRGAPTVRLVRPAEQPYVLDDGVVTLWELLSPAAEGPGPRGLGRLLRSLHRRADAPEGRELPRLDPFSTIRWQLDRPSPGFEAELLVRLADRAAELERAWNRACRCDPLSIRFVHGDAHADNVVVTRAGAVMVDLEHAGIGPASWDLVVPAVATRRYGVPADYFREVVAGYGRDPTRWSGFEMLCATYELFVAVWSMHCARLSPAMYQEALIRVETVAVGRDATWSQM